MTQMESTHFPQTSKGAKGKLIPAKFRSLKNQCRLHFSSMSRVFDAMAGEDKEGAVAGETHQLQIPISRVKKIMKLDQDINKVNSEALHLIASSTELFLELLAEKSAQVALEKKRKNIKLEHLRVALKRHQPTRDFLVDSLPMPSQPSDRSPKVQSRPRSSTDKPLALGTRGIEAFFQKCT